MPSLIIKYSETPIEGVKNFKTKGIDGKETYFEDAIIFPEIVKKKLKEKTILTDPAIQEEENNIHDELNLISMQFKYN